MRRSYPIVTVALICVALLLVAGPSAAQSQKKLYLYNWSQYMNPSILKAFEAKYDVKIVRSFYASNPQLFAKLRAGGDQQYDVIFPSSYYVPRLIKTGLIQPLNKKLIPNYANLMKRFANPSYDAGGKYTAAYQYGTTAILYNKKLFPNPPKSWSFLFDPKVNSKYPFSMMPDPAVMLSMGCAYLGYGYPCKNDDQWKQAAKLILKTRNRDNFSGFVGGTPVIQNVVRGNVDIAITYGGDFFQRRHKDPKLYTNVDYFIPKEGAELWVDTMAIPAHAPHPELANKFINFVLSAKMGAALSEFNAYPSPNAASQSHLAPFLTKPPVTLSPEDAKRVHLTPALSGAKLQLVQQLWTAVMSE